jgi:thiosulfate dehydrogenase
MKNHMRILTCPSILIAAALLSIGTVIHASPVPFDPPAESTIPKGPEGDAIKLGKLLLTDTRKQLPRNVGNALNCTNCHLNAGTVAFAGPFVGLWGMFPEYRSRSANISSLQERINDCFERSMNGKPLAYDSKEMNAMLMYMRWLSTGVPTGTEVVGRGMGKVDTKLVPNAAHGKTLYAQKCASCHGEKIDANRDPAIGYIFPPLWGQDSFNIGAGMARTYTAAAFIKHNMPLGQGNTLSDQEAIDIAEYVTHQPRPPFAPAKRDWPDGGKPKDARN